MIIRLQSTQIPRYWEVIKFCMTKVNEVDKGNLQPYLNGLLNSLLSDKAQCFVRFDKETREILSLAITKITADKIGGSKSLSIQCLYSFKAISSSAWKEGYGLIRDLATKMGCLDIILNTRNSKLGKLALSHGYKEKYRSYVHNLGGM